MRFSVPRAGCGVPSAACRGRRTAVIVFVMTLAAGGAGAAPVIDRVLAVVSGSIITLSDVNAAVGLGLVDTAGAADPIASALEQLIERSLMLMEVERYGPPEPDAARVEARVQTLRARFAGDATFREALAAYGLSNERLRDIARDDLRLDAYLTQRFASITHAGDEEVQRYYREHQAEFTREGAPLPLSEVEGAIRRRLDAAEKAARIEEWARGLRLRADVLILPR